MPDLMVMTFNIHMEGYKSKENAEKTVAAIVESQAQVVFLQESNPGWQAFLEERILGAYPFTCFQHDWHDYGGRGVLSKIPIVENHWCPKVFRWWYGAHMIRVNLDGTLITFLNIHLMAPFPSNPFSVQASRLKEMQSHFSKVVELMNNDVRNTVVLGDFNSAKGRSHNFLKDRGFSNALRQAGYVNRRTKTWTALNRRVGFLFDHIYYQSGSFELISAAVQKVGGSDHWPIVAHLRILSS